MLITRQAQTSTDNFLDYLGTDDLTIHHNGELKYGSFKGTIINQFTDDNFQQILNLLSDNVDDPPGNWEIRKGNTLLLSQHQNQLDLAIGTERLQQGLKQGNFSLGQALVGYWLIAELNEDNQWQYVLGSLSQQSLHQLQSSSHTAEYSQYSVNSSSSLDSSSSQSSDLIL